VNLPVRVEDRFTARLACDWLIHDRREIFPLLQWRVESRDGNDSPGRFDPARGPSIPRETDSWYSQSLSSVLLPHAHAGGSPSLSSTSSKLEPFMVNVRGMDGV
jgi:hypothetical protein